MSSLRALRPAARPVAALGRTAFASRPFHSTAARSIVHEVKSAQEFKTALEKQPKVVVDCFAEWCGPCKAISPIVSELSDHTKFKDDVYFVKLDVDQLPDVSQELCIRAMPTFLFFKDGKRVDELVGANPAVLAQKVEKFAA